MKCLLKSKKLTSMSTEYKKVNKFLSSNYKKEKRRCIQQFYLDTKIDEYKNSKIFLTGNRKKDLTRFFTENPGGIIKKKTVAENKLIRFISPKKIMVVAAVLGYVTYSIIFQYLIQIDHDKRPVAKEFANVEILPDNPDIERDEEGKIILNPVNNDELMAVESKLESQLEKGLKYFKNNDKIDNIFGIFNHPATDPIHGNENVIDIIVGSGNKTYSLQYYDIENDRENFEGIDEENATKTLTSFIKLLKTSAPYSITEFGANGKNIAEPFNYINKDSSSIYKVPVYNKDFTSCSLYTFSEDDFDENYATKLEPSKISETSCQSYTSVMNAYHNAIQNIANTTKTDYLAILGSFNIKSPDTDYQFKEENLEK